MVNLFVENNIGKKKTERKTRSQSRDIDENGNDSAKPTAIDRMTPNSV